VEPLNGKEPKEEPVVPLPTREELLDRSWRRRPGVNIAGVITGSLGFTFFLTTLFLAMRGVMDLGGMVAEGGPYEIAHPAPHWWWLIPVSIFGFMACGVLNLVCVRALAGVDLATLVFWPILFISLGWNFLEYGAFHEDGLVWGWLICAVVFFAMGITPVVLGLRSSSLKVRLQPLLGNVRVTVMQILAMAAGVIAGSLFFYAL
jgi:hypothetical protein